MKRSLMLGLSALCLGVTVQADVAVAPPAAGGPASAGQPPHPTNFDASLAGKASRPAPRGKRIEPPVVISGGLRYERLRPAPIVHDHYDADLERPTFAWAGKQGGSGAALLARQHGEDAAGYARAYLHELAGELRITPAAVDDAELVFLHDDDQGAVIARFQQRLHGLEVMNRQLIVIMKQDLELVAVSGYFADSRGAAKLDPGAAFRSGPLTAMSATFADLGLPVSAYNLYATHQDRAGFARFAPSASLATDAVGLTAPVGVKKVLFPVGNELVPAYFLVVQAGRAGSRNSLAYAQVTSADGSRVLFRKNLVAQDSYTYRVFGDSTTLAPDDSPFGNALVPHPTGNPADIPVTNFGAGTLLTVATASQGLADAWLPMPDAGGPVDATITRGNNVWAYADVAGSDGQDHVLDVYGQTTAAGVFDYTADFALQPAELSNQQAAVVNLFYLNNWLHDAWYNAGFTEAAGNAQVSNYGRGGNDSDPILAEAQDFSGRNNANMLTGPDGFSPRMQMFIFDNAQVQVQRVEITAPAAIAQVLEPTGGAAFGPADYAAFSGSVIAFDDGSAADTTGGATGTVTDGCQVATNGGALAGNIALIDRGTCNFTVKAANAEAAGAIAALVVNNEAGDIVVDMAGVDPAITIPALMISNVDGQVIRNELTNGSGAVTVEMARAVASDRDSSFDSQVVAHEFFHYVSGRLVGNASGLVNVQGGGMGEGWSDLAALLLTAREADLATNPAGAYSVGGYDVDNFFQAIRRFPYSTDMSLNPLTFADIAVDAEVHSIGEIWATALWEAYVGLYNHYAGVNGGNAFAEARGRMMGYVLEGLMATPNAPTMIEARDALLAVLHATDATDYGIFVTAFAKRGMGWGAIAPPRTSFDMAGVAESFETDLKTFTVQEAFLDPNAPTVCDADASLDAGETGQLTITVLNTGNADLSGVSARLSSTNDFTFSNGGVVAFTPDPLAMFGGTLSAVAAVTVNSAAQGEPMNIDVAFPHVGDTPDDVVEPATLEFRFIGNQDYAPGRFADDVELAAASLYDWTRTRTGSGIDWMVDSQLSTALGLPADNAYWHGPDNGSLGTTELVTPAIVVGGAPFSLGFWHYYQFESDLFNSYDGAVLEINIDGAGWQDVTAAGGSFAVGYNGVVTETGFGNPLEGRAAFVATGGGAPENVSFGGALAGRTVQFRFRTATDVSVGDLGWIVDDITVTGAAAPVFSSTVAENGVCGDPAPVAHAGPNQDVAAGSAVTLDGSGSSDNGTLSFAWMQVSGAAVGLSDAAVAQPTFTAQAASYTFLLTVTDDRGQTAVDSVTVRVTDGQPVADAGTDQTVVAGTAVTLDGSLSVAGSGNLSYSWTQESGATVTLSDTGSVRPTFSAPFGPSSYAFRLTVTDDQARTASDSVTVNVTDDPPVADAGADQSVAGGANVTLDGSGSSDAEGFLTYAWVQVGGDSVTLSNAAAAQPSFTAPDADATLTFDLTVSDQGGSTATDRVAVTVTRQSQGGTPNPPTGGGGGGGGGAGGWWLLGGLLAVARLRRRPS